ncbi:hypothetical protein [Bradyrhizobium elkanii]|uniref:hypothetical protein n=1 Tax=Bradyrhizobium elkanii TaxID=29448 RepID=UPI00216A4CC4|nr:hypothetical protein [Bradyrhizobium elkanii]MCS3690941.1 hypothetical protein [Bradyrhizobium elkanii]
MTVPQPKLILDSVTGSGSATNAGTFTSANIDTLGADYVSIDISATTQSASTQAGSPSVLKIQESDTTVVTSFADVVGFRGASATATNVDFVVGIGKTSGVNAYKFNVDCRGRKRYLNVVISPTTTQTFEVTANGFRLEQSASTASKAGVLNLVEG